jgi:hypothetical protein
MKISELVKGDHVMLNYGVQNGDIATCGDWNRYCRLILTSSFQPWEAEVVSKPRGKDPTVVFLLVHGFGEDIGDVYAHDIMAVQRNGEWVKIEHTPKQLELKKLVNSM